MKCQRKEGTIKKEPCRNAFTFNKILINKNWVVSFLVLFLQYLIPTPVGWHKFSPLGVCVERIFSGIFFTLTFYPYGTKQGSDLN